MILPLLTLTSVVHDHNLVHCHLGHKFDFIAVISNKMGMSTGGWWGLNLSFFCRPKKLVQSFSGKDEAGISSLHHMLFIKGLDGEVGGWVGG